SVYNYPSIFLGMVRPSNHTKGELLIHPVPQNAPYVSAGMNVLSSPRGLCTKAADVSPWYGVDA
ncbi:MAG: hypothetical protein V3U14_07295, partial [candidate division NC10 bacterium]